MIPHPPQGLDIVTTEIPFSYTFAMDCRRSSSSCSNSLYTSSDRIVIPCSRQISITCFCNSAVITIPPGLYGSFNINTLIGEFCSYNHIQRSWYVDACISASQIHKDLSNEKWQNLSLSTSRLLKGAKGVNHEFSVGYNHYIGKIYEQSQVKLGIDTIFASGMFFGVDTTLGEIVSGHLATRYAFGVNATRFIAQKPVKISFAYKQSDGGSWLGVMRDEQSSSIQVKFPLWGAVSAVVGYNQKKSNVDYFNDAYPNFGLQLADIRF